MSLMINTNIDAFDAHRNLVNTENSLSKSMQRLSSGLRINSAADDAAGLAISQKLTGQVNGLDQAQRNAQDGVSMVQTAEGSLNQVHAMLQRVRELAVQYGNGTLAASDQAAIQSEVNQLQSEIARIGSTAQFNGIALFSGSTTVSFQVGANDGEVISVSTQAMSSLVGMVSVAMPTPVVCAPLAGEPSWCACKACCPRYTCVLSMVRLPMLVNVPHAPRPDSKR